VPTSPPQRAPAAAGVSHTVLVLGRGLDGLPWEALPALQQRSLSRIAALPFLTSAASTGPPLYSSLLFPRNT